MLGGISQDPAAKNLHNWHQVLKVDRKKQVLFMHRVLLLHIASKKGGPGRASSNRLSLENWVLECDRACLVGHILQDLASACDPMGAAAVTEETIDSIALRAVEGTFG